MGPAPNPPAVHFGPVELSTSISSASQTLSPDGKVLSILFTGLSVQAQGTAPRAAALAGSLTVPLDGVTSPIFVKMDFRGDASATGTGASGRLGIEVNGVALGSGFSEPGGPIRQDFTLQLSPDAPFVVLNLVVSGQVFGADTAASAIVTLDSIDLTFQ